jgi:hypothetical protein
VTVLIDLGGPGDALRKATLTIAASAAVASSATGTPASIGVTVTILRSSWPRADVSQAA